MAKSSKSDHVHCCIFIQPLLQTSQMMRFKHLLRSLGAAFTSCCDLWARLRMRAAGTGISCSLSYREPCLGSDMTSILSVRQFVCERLTAAALEILGAFEKSLDGYELELARQRGLLESALETKPHVEGRSVGRSVTGEKLNTFVFVSKRSLSCSATRVCVCVCEPADTHVWPELVGTS